MEECEVKKKLKITYAHDWIKKYQTQEMPNQNAVTLSSKGHDTMKENDKGRTESFLYMIKDTQNWVHFDSIRSDEA